MAKIPVSPHWSANPTIEIYLDPSSGRQTTSPPPQFEEHICPTCGVSSRDAAIHCLSVSPSPPSYSSITQTPSRHLTVPTLHLQMPSFSMRPRPQAPLPSLQIDPEGRPNIRFRKTAFSPLSPPSARVHEYEHYRKDSLGLGITDAHFVPDVSPVTPGTIERAEDDNKPEESLGAPSNFAQRIEQKLWKYSASRNVVKRWLLEMISWSLSALCMGGICVMLWVYHNKGIPSWPLGLTLNAYISVLAKVASAGLLLPTSEALGQLKWSWFNKENSKRMWDFEIFDNASRGPWGSFLLLVRTKGRSLAALGAAVTVFALALDPFFQQLVQYPERWRLQPGFGVIPRAISYDPYQAGQQFRQHLGQHLELDFKLYGIASRFFWDNGTAPMKFGKGARADIALSCSSSNCTWPAYETLGICSKCTEAYDTLEFKCLNTTLDWVTNPELNETSGYIQYSNGTSCGWWLKADTDILMTGYNVDPNSNHTGEVLLQRSQPLYDINDRTPLYGYPSKLNHTRNPLAHVIIVSGEDVMRVRRNDTPIAHECLISWCVKELLSEYSGGGYSEAVNNTYFNSTLGEGDPWQTTNVFDKDGMLFGTDYIYKENVTVVSPSGNVYLSL